MIFQYPAFWEKEKNMPYVQKILVAAPFLDFQANIFSFLFKPRDGTFLI